MKQHRPVRWFARLVLAALPVAALTVASCLAEEPDVADPLETYDAGTQVFGRGCVGASCEEACAAHPMPGCACAEEGEEVACGQIHADLDGHEVCGKGFSVCTRGRWAECVIDNAVSLVPEPPPGEFMTDSLSVGTKCATNPCDPACVDWLDTPTGIGDAGAKLQVLDGGLTLLGDGGSVCVPKTCADLGRNCGPVSDTCGGLLQCGTCTGANTCGGGGTASVCGVPSTCTNLCLKQVHCSGTVTTSVTGKVYAPNGTDPLPNVQVFVPNATPAAFTTSVACDNCANLSGSPLVSATTAVDGSFTINNMPVGTNIPLVIQIGRWRRQVVIPTVTACTNTAIAATLTRLPRTKAEGDIPKMAFVTGAVDAMECVWRKIGIADSEFTNPSGTGRIHLYAGGDLPGAYIGNIGGTNGTPYESTLLGSASTLAAYDMVLFPCQGEEYHYNKNTQKAYSQAIADYANAGGRVFATHFSYGWLFSDNSKFFSPLSPALNWSVGQASPTPDPQTGYVDTSFPKGAVLAQWLQTVGASTVAGQIQIDTLRRDFTSVVAPTQRWLSVNKPTAGIAQHVTFNTPLGAPAANQCGRVVFSDFHVENSSNAQYPFPTECPGGAMTPQEKLLEFMLFDLASCVQPDQVAATCTPVSCSAQGLNCGLAGDGCGNQINCGTCASPTTCGGGGAAGVCGTPSVYSDATFTRDYAATSCPTGTAPVWSLWSWTATTPLDSRIEFSVQTATTAAGLATAPADAVLFSNPPGPSALVNQAAIAHAVNAPTGSPDTQLGSASMDYTLRSKQRTPNLRYLRVSAHLVPSTNKSKAPTLSSWDLQMSCQPFE